MAEHPNTSLIPAVWYQNPRAALAWLQKAFGFHLTLLIEDADGHVVHAEMGDGAALLMLGPEWMEDFKSPCGLGGKNSQTVHIQITTDIQAHFERARAAGAEVIMAPVLQFYGDSTYRCRDPEGHIWSVSQTIAPVERQAAEAASGLKITRYD